MKNLIKYFGLALATLIFASCAGSAINNATAQNVNGTPLQKSDQFSFNEGTPVNLKLDKDNIDKVIEPSGVIAVDNEGKFLLVIDDKSDTGHTENLRIFTETGEFVSKLTITPAPAKPKWEAIAKDDDGFYYVVGSHAGDSKDKIIKRSTLYRFKLAKDEATGTFKIDETSQKPIQFDIKSALKELNFYAEEPADNKVKIEGLAVKNIEGKKNLIIGLREPEGITRVYSAEIPAELNELVKLSLKPYFQFDAGKTEDGTLFKLSSIEYVPQMKGFLVLTSSETTVKAANGKDKPVFHGNGLWFIGDEELNSAQNVEGFKSVKAIKISNFRPEFKAEGIGFIPNADQTKLRFAIVFDNDTEDMVKAAVQNPPLGMLETIELIKKP